MLQKLIERRNKGNEEGFTLIELMVVVLIIAILIAIAIPTFLGARQRAQNRSAQSNIRNALTAEKTVYTDNQQYADDSASALTNVEPSLSYTTNAASLTGGTHLVYAQPSDGANPKDTVTIGAKSASGKCYWLQDVAGSPGTQWNTSTSCTLPTTWTGTSVSQNPPS